MRRIIFLMIAAVSLSLLLAGCGTCDPNPEPGTCALQTCGDASAGNWQENYECRGDDDERWGWQCQQNGTSNIRCETFE